MRNKLQMFIVAIAAVGAGTFNVQAQTDVTTQYLTNADFEESFDEFVRPQANRVIYRPEGWTVERKGTNVNDLTCLLPTHEQANNFSDFTITCR